MEDEVKRCPNCRRELKVVDKDTKKPIAQTTENLMCGDCTSGKIPDYRKLKVWYFEMREGNKALFAMIPESKPAKAKKKFMELVDGGDWQVGILPADLAFDMLSRFPPNVLHEATLEDFKPKLILPHDGLIGHA